jgi:outer membrane receptor protein involved in Fe transport
MIATHGDQAALPAAGPRGRRGLSRCVAALALGLVPVCIAIAQSPPPAQAAAAAPSAAVQGGEPAAETPAALQEIVVTATRRSELLSKVPISVSAFTQESLDARGVKDFSDLVRFTPGVTLDANGTNNISIRGISSSAGAGTTGIYIDDTPIQMRALSFYSNDTLPKTFDLERVEVLRGPQGTLFGAGAEGGAVRYIMTQPNLRDPSVYARSEVSFTQAGAPSYEAGVAYGAPIVANELGFRASIWYRYDGGWIDRINPFTMTTDQSNANYAKDVVARLAVKWAPNENVSVTPSFLYQNLNVNDVTAYWPVLSNPDSDRYRNGDPDRLPEPDRYYLPALKVDAELGSVRLISNTSYFHRTNLGGYNGTDYNLSYYQTFNSTMPMVNPSYYPLIDGSGPHLPAGLQNYRAPAKVTNQLQSFTQEVRLQSDDPNAKLSWTAGLFYEVNRQQSIEEIHDPMLNTLLATLFGSGTTALSVFGEDLLANGDAFDAYNFSRDRQYAGFGEVSYALTDHLKATAGLRYSKVDVSFFNAVDGPQNFGPTGGSGQQHEKPATPKFSLAYQLDPDNMFYATYTKGYRIGGANAPIPVLSCAQDLGNLGLTAAPASYKSDTVNSYEVGSKNRFADRLRIASSLYYIKWHGIQQQVFLPLCGFQFTANSGEAVAKGGDVQIEFAPTRSLTFDLAVGRTDATFSRDVYIGTTASLLLAAKGDAIEGASVTPAPPWSVALGMQYDFLALDHKSFVRLDYEFEAHNGTATPSEDPRTAIFDQFAYTPSPTNFVSLRAGTTIERWSVSAFVDNLFDVHVVSPPSADPHTRVDVANPSPPSVLIRAYALRPRTIGITATYRL